MKKKDLLLLLKDIPDDTEIMVKSLAGGVNDIYQARDFRAINVLWLLAYPECLQQNFLLINNPC